MTPDAYVAALAEVGKLIVKAGVVLDRLDVGGGFPSIYSELPRPAPLSAFMHAISTGVEKLPIGNHCRLMCEPGRALVAEAESLIVRVVARRGNELFINDGSYGSLFDAAHLNFNFPVKLVSQPVDAQRAARRLRAVGADLRHHRPHEGAVPPAGQDQGRRLHRVRQHRRLQPSAGQPLQRLWRLRGGDPAR